MNPEPSSAWCRSGLERMSKTASTGAAIVRSTVTFSLSLIAPTLPKHTVPKHALRATCLAIGWALSHRALSPPRSPISGQHCREAILEILDEVFGNLQRREVSPGFRRPPPDDLSVPLLCPGARILFDVAGILGDCRRDVDPKFRVERGVAFVIDSGRRRAGSRQPVQRDVVKNAISGDRLERAVFGICPLGELVQDPGEKPGR